MSTPFTIIQISDVHICEQGEKANNVDVRHNFHVLLDHLKDKKFDLLVLTGDVAYRDGSPEVYDWVYSRLKTLHVPFYTISGNHDITRVLARSFDLLPQMTKNNLYYSASFKEFQLIFLDSSSGRVSRDQLDWLESSFRNDKNKLLFIHHPPAKCNEKYMDTNYPLKNMADMQRAIKSLDHLQGIFCGHYHIDKSMMFDFGEVHICPSTWFQLDSTDAKEFRIKSHDIGYRIITWDGERLDTKPIMLKM